MTASRPGSNAPAFYSVQSFAKLVDLHPRTIRRHLENGVIRHVRIGNAVRIPASEVERLSTPVQAAS